MQPKDDDSCSMIKNESKIVIEEEKVRQVCKPKANPTILVQEDDATIKLEVSDCELETFQEAYTYHKQQKLTSITDSDIVTVSG